MVCYRILFPIKGQWRFANSARLNYSSCQFAETRNTNQKQLASHSQPNNGSFNLHKVYLLRLKNRICEMLSIYPRQAVTSSEHPFGDSINFVNFVPLINNHQESYNFHAINTAFGFNKFVFGEIYVPWFMIGSEDHKKFITSLCNWINKKKWPILIRGPRHIVRIWHIFVVVIVERCDCATQECPCKIPFTLWLCQWKSMRNSKRALFHTTFTFVTVSVHSF